MSGAADLVRYVERATGFTFTDDQARALGVLHVLGAPYNMPVNWDRIIRRRDGVEVRYDGPLSTFDNDALTRLVLAAHDARVRAEVEGAQGGRGRGVLITLTARDARTGHVIERLPTIEHALAIWRTSHPEPTL